MNDQIWRRHTDQLLDHNVVVEPEDVKERDIPEVHIPPLVALPESLTVTETEILISETEHGSSEPQMQDSNAQTETSVPRHYPRREHKPPDRLSHKDGGNVVYLILCYVIMCNCGCITCCVCVCVYKTHCTLNVSDSPILVSVNAQVTLVQMP